MRKETVPIDMSSEQKTMLGIISKRQLIYIAVGGAILYVYIPMVFNLFPNLIMGCFASLISAVPTIALVVILAFYKKQKLHLNFDQYIMLRIGYKGQIGIWRKGSRQKDWMVK